MAVWTIGYVVILALIVAFWEIQIEGKHGWAEKLPCWRKESGWIVKYILEGRPLTGFHIGLVASLLAMFHLVFFFSTWNFRAEMFILGLFLELLLLEDFFWFLLNPYYGIKKYKKQYIWWYKKWLGPLPSSYYLLLIGAGLLIYFGLPGVI